MDTERIISDVRNKILSTGSPKTADTYESGLRPYCEYFDKKYTHPKHIPTKEIVKFFASMREKKIDSNGKVKSRDSMARTSFWAVKYLYTEIEDQPHKFDGLKPVRIKPKPRMPLEKDFVLSKIDAIQDRRDRALIATLFLTGIRRQECAILRVSDIDWANDVIHILGKWNKRRLVPMTERLREVLTDYIIYFRPREWLFAGEKTGHYLSPSTILKKVHRYLGTCTHVTRYSFANTLRKEGADLLDVRDLLGHASLRTTEGYLKNDMDHLKQVCGNSFDRKPMEKVA